MSMKTPEQIASQVVNDNTAPEEWSPVLMSEVAGLVAAGIEADRAQRNIIAQVAEVLDDRGAHAAAQLVRDTDPDDDLWNNYIGPMIDSIEDDCTGMAKEINA